MIRAVVKSDHVVGAGGEWEFHEWYFTGREVKADRLGRTNPRMVSRNWLLIQCNNSACPGRAIVCMEDVLALLPPAPQSKPLGVAP